MRPVSAALRTSRVKWALEAAADFARNRGQWLARYRLTWLGSTQDVVDRRGLKALQKSCISHHAHRPLPGTSPTPEIDHDESQSRRPGLGRNWPKPSRLLLAETRQADSGRHKSMLTLERRRHRQFSRQITLGDNIQPGSPTEVSAGVFPPSGSHPPTTRHRVG